MRFETTQKSLNKAYFYLMIFHIFLLCETTANHFIFSIIFRNNMPKNY